MSAEAEVTRLQKENEALRQVFQRLAGGAKVEDLEDLMKQSKPKQPKEMKKEHEVLFTPISIAGCQLKNRFALAPLGPAGLSDANGAFTQRAVDYYVERARGGTALIMTGIVKVENEIEKCPPVLPCATQCPGAFLQTLRVMAERVHSYGAKLFVQLTAGFGRVAIYPGLVSSYPVSASAIPNRWHPEIICKELTTEQVQTYVKKFAEAAAICQHAGVDGVEVHAVHEGYLLDQFAIAMFNHRTDQYGGSLENRLRFATEIVQAIKAACGKTYPVSLRLSLKSYIKDWCQGALPGEKFEEKGRDMPEGLEAAKLLEKAGYDAFNSDAGTYDAWYWAHPPQYQAKGLYLPMNEQLKKVVHIPVITAGRMEDPDLASKAIMNHQTDMIGLGRPLLADSEVPNKIRAGDFGAVRPCISCQEGCIGRLAVYAQISCAVNPACAREREYGLLPTIRRKHVIVVGGGVAGMETARVAAVRGHRVDLYERSQRLGGLLIPAGIPDFKEDERRLVAWYERAVAEAGVNVHLGQEIDAAGILAAGADSVVFATGSRPKIFDFAGAKNVFTAEDVLEGKRDAGKKTVMVGGGVTGCETALWLRSKGTEVTIVEFRDKILEPGPLCMANKTMLEDLVHFKGVTVHTSSKVIAPAQGGFEVEGPDGKHFVVPADSAVLAVGSSPERKLYEEVSKKSGAEVFLIGDANHVGNIMSAIWDAYEIARSL